MFRSETRRFTLVGSLESSTLDKDLALKSCEPCRRHGSRVYAGSAGVSDPPRRFPTSDNVPLKNKPTATSMWVINAKYVNRETLNIEVATHMNDASVSVNKRN